MSESVRRDGGDGAGGSSLKSEPRFLGFSGDKT